jgi:hypothetical protein
MIIVMIFNMITSYFHKISFHYFEDYLMTKLTLGGKVIASDLMQSRSWNSQVENQFWAIWRTNERHNWTSIVVWREGFDVEFRFPGSWREMQDSPNTKEQQTLTLYNACFVMMPSNKVVSSGS